MTAEPVRTDLHDPPGVRFVPAEPSGVGVLVLAGSRGAADPDRARILATHGAITTSIQWFGGPGQHPGPWEIPIETFQEAITSLRADCDRIVLVGVSFGAEAAMLTASHTDGIDAVAAFAPTDVVWAGVTDEGRQTSHWTIAGAPVPFVGFDPDWRASSDPPAFRDLYRASRKRDPEAVAAATIPVERIPTLVQVVGGDDQVWPSDLHAEQISARRRAHGLPTTTVNLADAGHRTLLPGETEVRAGVRMRRGGTPRADRELGLLAWQEILPLLSR